MAGIPRMTLATFGLGIAQAGLAATFRGPREEFWQRMTTTGLALAGYALLVGEAPRRTRIGPREVAIGAVSAATLYGTFWVGDRVAGRAIPTADRDIREIHKLRRLKPRPEIALRLVTVIAPAEELFWRGLLQHTFATRFGRWRGAALATAAYSGAHVVSGNLTLIGAAGIAGAHWSALYAAGVPLGALIVSHAAWDIAVFLIQPTRTVGTAAGDAGAA